MTATVCHLRASEVGADAVEAGPEEEVVHAGVARPHVEGCVLVDRRTVLTPLAYQVGLGAEVGEVVGP
jgi:hypothetical protein